MAALRAIALLRIPASDIPAAKVVRALEDGVLVHTDESFGAEEEEIALALRRAAGDALDRHRDSRGVMILPDVAEPAGESYDAIVEEIGEGGTWIPIDDEDDDDGDDLLATMMQAMADPAMAGVLAQARSVLGSAGAGPDAASLEELARSMAEEMEREERSREGVEVPDLSKLLGSAGAMPDLGALLGSAGAMPDLSKLLGGIGGMPDLGALLGDPAMQKMVAGMSEQLMKDPTKLAELTALLGGSDEDEDVES